VTEHPLVGAAALAGVSDPRVLARFVPLVGRHGFPA
jgi:hypothetical protein